jgi:Tol biopolymer transport system component
MVNPPVRFVEYTMFVYAGGQYHNWEIFINRWDGDSTRLMNNSFNDIEPRLVRGNNKIIFVSNRSGNLFKLYAMNIDGSGQVKISSGNGNDRFPSVTQDGGRIAFTSDRDGQTEIYTD